jgi:hypothetical protein
MDKMLEMPQEGSTFYLGEPAKRLWSDFVPMRTNTTGAAGAKLNNVSF